MPDDIQQPLETLVDMGRAIGELGVSLTEAQWRIDQGALDVAVGMAEWARPAFEQIAPDHPDRDLAREYARDRTVFYSMPQVNIRLETSLRITRSRGGLVQTLLGIGSNKSNSQETSAFVEVTMAAVPMSMGLQNVMELRTRELQGNLLQFLAIRGFFGPPRAQALAKYALQEADAPANVAASGSWAEPAWQQLLITFKKVWNQDQAGAPEETALRLAVNARPDRATLGVLEDLLRQAEGAVDPQALRKQARILLSAINQAKDVRSDATDYPRDGWDGTRWPRLLFEVLAVLQRKHGIAVRPVEEPDAQALEALRNAWDSQITVTVDP